MFDQSHNQINPWTLFDVFDHDTFCHGYNQNKNETKLHIPYLFWLELSTKILGIFSVSRLKIIFVFSKIHLNLNVPWNKDH